MPDDALAVTKTRHSAFVRTDIEPLLKTHGVDRLVLAGIFLEATLSDDGERAKAMLAFLQHAFQVECAGVDEIVAGRPRPAAARAAG